MKRARATSSSLFLMEIIIALAVFAGAGVMCTRVFVSAHVISKEAKVYNYAVSEFSSVAETIGAVDSYEDAAGLIKKRYPKAETTAKAKETVFRAAFDDDGDNIAITSSTNAKVKAAYTITIKLSETNGLLVADMTSQEADYSLTAKHNLKGLNK